MKTYFDHEKLNVYQEAIRFIAWVSELLENVAANNQLDRASTSIPLNIAEGNGKYTSPDRCRFFDISRGSSLESAACLDVLCAKKIIGKEIADDGKEILSSIVAMLTGLIKSNSPDRVYEEPVAYGVRTD